MLSDLATWHICKVLHGTCVNVCWCLRLSTQVGSRRVVQYGAAIMFVLGSVGKFTALFASLPDPILGGMFCTLFGELQVTFVPLWLHVCWNSDGGMLLVQVWSQPSASPTCNWWTWTPPGTSLFSGFLCSLVSLCRHTWTRTPTPLKPVSAGLRGCTYQASVLQPMGECWFFWNGVGVPELDQILTVLLSTEMFVGGFLAFCLDNTIPGNARSWEDVGKTNYQKSKQNMYLYVFKGSREERGLVHWNSSSSSSSSPTYEFPLGMGVVKRIRWLRWLPISPTFTGFRCPDNPPHKEEEEEEKETDIALSSTKV